MGHHKPTHPPDNFRGSGWEYKVQMESQVPLSVRKVSQVIPGGQQEGEHGVVHQVQGEHYKRKF